MDTSLGEEVRRERGFLFVFLTLPQLISFLKLGQLITAIL